MPETQSDPTIYISTDIEADGPVPGLNSMLSFGSAAFSMEKGLLGTFSANLELLPGASPDANTMTEFWAKNPEAWEACRKDLQPMEKALPAYADWLRSFGKDLLFVGYPATYDFQFINYYLHRYTGSNPMGFDGFDVKSYAAGVLGVPYRKASKKSFPKAWIPEQAHTHVAVDDAIEQGWLFFNMYKARLASTTSAV